MYVCVCINHRVQLTVYEGIDYKYWLVVRQTYEVYVVSEKRTTKLVKEGKLMKLLIDTRLHKVIIRLDVSRPSKGIPGFPLNREG